MLFYVPKIASMRLLDKVPHYSSPIYPPSHVQAPIWLQSHQQNNSRLFPNHWMSHAYEKLALIYFLSSIGESTLN